jgi:hypothetical protein
MSSFTRRRRDGRLAAMISEPMIELLTQVVRELGEVIEAPPSGAIADRLFQRAYLDPTEEHAEQEWQSVVHDDLAESRAQAIGAVLGDLEAALQKAKPTGDATLVLTDDTAWLTVVNDARLTLGVLLEISDDDQEPTFATDDPRSQTAFVYGLLGGIQQELVEALLEELGESGTD